MHNSVLWFSQADQFRLADLRESAKRFTARNLRRIKDQDGGTLTLLSQELLLEVVLEMNSY